MNRVAWPLVLAVFVVLAAFAGVAPFADPLCGDSLAAGPALPKAATPEEVAALLAKPPAGFEIIDIRPQPHFAEYSLPGSINLDAGVVLADASVLAGTGPLVLVDTDGSSAFAVAGVLAQKTRRPVWALAGGLAAWWAATEKGAAVRAMPLADAPAATPVAAPTAPPAPGAAPGAEQGQGLKEGSSPGAPPGQTAPRVPGAPKPATTKNAGC